MTYIATGEGWLYLACVMDLASRRIVGWSMSERIKAELVCEALKMAYWRRKPPAGLILHSDRGGGVRISVCKARLRLVHGGGRRLRRTTDAVGKSVVHVTQSF